MKDICGMLPWQGKINRKEKGKRERSTDMGTVNYC